MFKRTYKKTHNPKTPLIITLTETFTPEMISNQFKQIVIQLKNSQQGLKQKTDALNKNLENLKKFETIHESIQDAELKTFFDTEFLNVYKNRTVMLEQDIERTKFTETDSKELYAHFKQLVKKEELEEAQKILTTPLEENEEVVFEEENE